MDNPSRSPLPTYSPDPSREARRIPSRIPFAAHEAVSPAPSVGDIYYILFRQKWKIILCGLLGLVSAAVFYKLHPPLYRSSAQLFIRYVTESQGLSSTGEEAINTKSIGQRGDTTLASEVAILSSLDLSKQVAASIGPEKILAQYGDGSKDLNQAAGVVRGGLTVEIARGSNVLNLSFESGDLSLVQPVLAEVIERYLKRHVEIHRGTGMVDGFLAQQTDQLRTRLSQTEDELRKALNKAGVISLAESKNAYAQQISRLKQEIFAAEAELSERSSLLQEISPPATKATQSESSEPAVTATEATPEQIRNYQGFLTRIDALQKREMELLTYFREDNTRVVDVRTQLSDLQAKKETMEQAHPGLIRLPVPSTSQGGVSNAANDRATEIARLNALKAKIKTLNAQLQSIRTEAANTDQLEISILQLMRQKELEETNYKNYSQSLEQARINEAMGNGSVSNISQVQTPSPPQADRVLSNKISAGLAGSGFALGLIWAVLIEFYFDRSVRRPVDVERMLRLPLFLSIPKLSQKELLLKNTPASGSRSPTGEPESSALVVPQDNRGQALEPFHETLRDRLISYFESKGLTHKPKMVAVTGLGRNSGVTTTAAGLAASLSRTGDGNVLLVDMTNTQGSAQQFYHGKPVRGLEELLDARDTAKVDNNLYVVGEEPGGVKLSSILPNRFNKLVPKLKASNFDYIIFDMPPVSQISITPRLAGFMDMVLLVIESEKTDRNIVQRATALLAESKAHVGAVLNKSKTYVPPSLHQDNLGNL